LIRTSRVFPYIFINSLTSTLFPYTTLFRSLALFIFLIREPARGAAEGRVMAQQPVARPLRTLLAIPAFGWLILAGLAFNFAVYRSEEHTSELQSRENLVCRLLLEKKQDKYK